MPKWRHKKVSMGEYTPTDEEVEAYVWGVNNGIRVAPKPAKDGWHVEIYSNKRWKHNGEVYGPTEVWKQLFKYYTHYYEQNRG